MDGGDAAGRIRQPLPRQPAPRAHDHLPLRWLNSGILRMAEVESELDVSAFVRFAVLSLYPVHPLSELELSHWSAESEQPRGA